MMQTQDIAGNIQKNILNIGIILACVFIAFKIYNGQMEQVRAIKAEAENARQKNMVLDEIVQSEKRLKTLRRNINNNKNETSVINTMNKIAKDFGVKIIELRPVQEQKVSGYSRHPFTLSIALDNYHTLGRFISALESDPFLFTIDNMSVNNEDSGESRIYRLHVNLEVSTILIWD